MVGEAGRRAGGRIRGPTAFRRPDPFGWSRDSLCRAHARFSAERRLSPGIEVCPAIDRGEDGSPCPT